MEKALVAGASGYLGGHLVEELKRRGKFVRVLVRTEKQAERFRPLVDEVFLGRITEPETLKGVAKGMDAVYSSVGITRQRDGMTYEAVDFQGNMNLLAQALESKVPRFLYVSVLKGESLRHIKICDAKERFVDALVAAPIKHTIMRPTGFFSDLLEVFNMARKGRVMLIGDGENKSNPISGRDLAVTCCDSADAGTEQVPVGGPDTLTQNEIAKIAFAVLNKKPKIMHIPGWITTLILTPLRLLTTSRFHGTLEFFLTVLTISFEADEYGKDTLKDFYSREAAV